MKGERLDAGRISSWAEMVVLPRKNKGVPDCESPVQCFRDCVRAAGVRGIWRRGVDGEQLEEEFEDAAGVCALMRAAVEEAKEKHELWMRVAGGKDKKRVGELASFLEKVAAHRRSDRLMATYIASVAHVLCPRKRRRKGESQDEDDDGY